MTNNVLEAWVVCHLSACTRVLLHHAMVWHWCPTRLLAASIVAALIIIVVVAALVGKVLRTLVFVCAAILYPISMFPLLCDHVSIHIGSDR